MNEIGMPFHEYNFLQLYFLTASSKLSLIYVVFAKNNVESLIFTRLIRFTEFIFVFHLRCFHAINIY